MIVPTTVKIMYFILQALKEHKVAVEEVCCICDAEEAPSFKLVENIIVDTCYRQPKVSPKPLEPWKFFYFLSSIFTKYEK